ncbi:hypothetical protein PSTT_14828 [Puccinia striiformis]|uniref:Uncharacterized protein n=1 Tax=Puccinia striiformis TaxID=27350 RepID=A0A2S4UKH2_9BASI|nr:hypothetical protein PSTT_14828 [Puccinia striiformis]
MLEGSFRPASSAAGPHHQFPINPKSGYPDQASPVVNMRKDHSGPSFTPVHDRPASSHSPDYESEDHQQLGSPPGQPPHYFKNHPSLANQSQSNQSLVAHQAAPKYLSLLPCPTWKPGRLKNRFPKIPALVPSGLRRNRLARLAIAVTASRRVAPEAIRVIAVQLTKSLANSTGT